MREIYAADLVDKIALMCQEANYFLAQDVIDSLKQARNREESPLGQSVLDDLLDNAHIASCKKIPLCQDTGVASFFIELGQEVILKGNLEEAINKGVAKGYIEGYLRPSILNDPLERKNTKDNTPAIIHLRLVKGEKIKIQLLVKGGGSENMSKVTMLTPASGLEGVKDFVLQTVVTAGANPCPPIIVGIGLGGNLEKAALLSKEALLHPLSEKNPKPEYALLEEELLEKINSLGIGPAGFGGRISALAVHILSYPCHITALPVAVSINCHAHRVVTAIL